MIAVKGRLDSSSRLYDGIYLETISRGLIEEFR
jgi:hypothetical protein